MHRLVIVGEGPNPTYEDHPNVHPLFGNPARKLTVAAGWVEVGQSDVQCYKALLRRAHPVNLCTGRYNAYRALKSANERWAMHPVGVFVLLGRRVATAFSHDSEFYQQVERGGRYLAVIPHPSGLNRMWNDSDTWEKAGKTLRDMYALSLHTWP